MENTATAAPTMPEIKDATVPLENSEKQMFLIECMKENLQHARHVENERLTFISLLLVSVGMILEFASSMGSVYLKVFLCIVLFLLNFICTRLLIRWNAIFGGHSEIAQKIAMELREWYSQTPPQHVPGAASLGAANSLYLFDNKLASWISKQKNSEDVAEDGEPTVEIAPDDYRYTRTSKYFYWFNALVYIIIAVFLINSLI